MGARVKGVPTPDDAAGEIGVVRVGGGFAVREDIEGVEGVFTGPEEKLNRTRLVRFLAGKVTLSIELNLITDVLEK